MVACGVCGLYFDASPRSARDYRAGRTPPRCMLHRARGARPQTRTAELRRFWLDRFSREEIVDMAHALFPRGTTRGLPSALTASIRESNGLDPQSGRPRV